MVFPGRFFFALFSLFRYSISLGLLERPLVVGFFWGVFTGEYTVSLNIAIFFELFWLDLIPVGSFIPPHLTAATFSALSLTTYLGFVQPAQIMVILFASMPLAGLGTLAEGWIRDSERMSYNKLLNWVRKPEKPNLPGTLILRSLARTFLISWGVFFVAILILKVLLEFAFSLYPGLVASLNIQWAHLWIIASLGGLMALRVKRAYAVLATGIILFVVFSLYRCF
ncbi:PTS sugar transporter subunit IIC [Pseudodesulfovibrio sediminis]|uniref:PTS sugar transporter subunit IIC n=1 Tax=Pseudodesulfovibrio sediminis TaxID=2810563 RepID=UPI0024C068D4|nr:PTS sugar transporter subunit IIC [Pseudodesulfovibrio sediminis]